MPAVPTASDKYPLQNERERKEQLYMDAMLLFDRGKSWEHGIPLCQELAQLYEMEMFDYRKLSAILVSVCMYVCFCGSLLDVMHSIQTHCRYRILDNHITVLC